MGPHDTHQEKEASLLRRHDRLEDVRALIDDLVLALRQERQDRQRQERAVMGRLLHMVRPLKTTRFIATWVFLAGEMVGLL
jgi:hypothetical protein